MAHFSQRMRNTLRNRLLSRTTNSETGDARTVSGPSVTVSSATLRLSAVTGHSPVVRRVPVCRPVMGEVYPGMYRVLYTHHGIPGYIPGGVPSLPTGVYQEEVPSLPTGVYHRVHIAHQGIPQGAYSLPGYTSGCGRGTYIPQGVVEAPTYLRVCIYTTGCTSQGVHTRVSSLGYPLLGRNLCAKRLPFSLRNRGNPAGRGLPSS